MPYGKCNLQWCGDWGQLVPVFRPDPDDPEPLHICKKCLNALGISKNEVLPPAAECVPIILARKAGG